MQGCNSERVPNADVNGLSIWRTVFSLEIAEPGNSLGLFYQTDLCSRHMQENP